MRGEVKRSSSADTKVALQTPSSADTEEGEEEVLQAPE